MKSSFSLPAVAALAVTLLVNPGDAAAQSYYTSGHTDIGLAYEDGELHPHWHLEAGNIVDGSPLPADAEYEPGDLIAVFQATRPAANGAADYLGVSAGTLIYMGGPSVAWQPYLGFGSEELNPGDWSGPIVLSLTGWTTPAGGAFALYTTNLAGTNTTDIFLSTFDPSVADVDGLGENRFGLSAGGHDHFTFGFTTPGYYELTFLYEGNHITDGPVSAVATFGFQVVPEPSSFLLLAGAGFGAAALRWRNRRNRAS